MGARQQSPHHQAPFGHKEVPAPQPLCVRYVPVVVQARIDKGATVDPSQPLVAKRVVDQGAASTGGSGDTGSGDTGSGDSGDNTGDNSGSTPTP